MAGHRLVLLLVVVGMVLAAVADSLPGSVVLKHLAIAEQVAVLLSRTYSTEDR